MTEVNPCGRVDFYVFVNRALSLFPNLIFLICECDLSQKEHLIDVRICLASVEFTTSKTRDSVHDTGCASVRNDVIKLLPTNTSRPLEMQPAAEQRAATHADLSIVDFLKWINCCFPGNVWHRGPVTPFCIFLLRQDA